MAWLILGVLLWVAAHLFKRVLPGVRASMGKAGRGAVALAIVAGIVLMVIGYRSAELEYLYDLPLWVWHLNNLLMLFAVFLMGAGQAKGVVAAKLRHPMLTGVVIWSVAHLLVNGDVPSVILFGGLGLWAIAEMLIINRAEGPWTPPAPGPIRKDLVVAAVSVVLYGLIAGVHYWLGRPVFGVPG